MIFKHCKLIQDNGCILFYRYTRPLNGYEIAGLIIEPTMAGKISFAKIWKYFIKDIVGKDDIYCSILTGAVNDLFKNYTKYHSNINGIDIYKIDNYLQIINGLK